MCIFSDRLLPWSPRWLGTRHVDQAGFEPVAVLPLPPNCWNYRCVPPGLVFFLFNFMYSFLCSARFESRFLYMLGKGSPLELDRIFNDLLCMCSAHTCRSKGSLSDFGHQACAHLYLQSHLAGPLFFLIAIKNVSVWVICCLFLFPSGPFWPFFTVPPILGTSQK